LYFFEKRFFVNKILQRKRRRKSISL